MSKKKSMQVVKNESQQKKTGQFIVYLVIFIFGFLSGVGFTIYKSDPVPTTTSTNTVNQPKQNSEMTQAILNLEAEVTANPTNFEAWTRLGHLYYDNNQPQKAIGAYTKSLELHSGDANLLTDLGVMYRRTGQSEKAVEQFNKAIARDSSHIQSRFNKGIVLFYDLNKNEEAIGSWESILAIDPKAKTSSGEPMTAFIEKMKGEVVQQNK